jgi:hypothetical protein
MAQIIEENIIIKISQIAKDGIKAQTVVSDELLSTLESVTQELLGNSAVVEVEQVPLQ